MSSEWLDKSHKCSREIRLEADSLAYLASSFSSVGNDHIAERLARASNRLLCQADIVSEVASDVASKDLDSARESMAGVASFALSFGKYEMEKSKQKVALLHAQYAIATCLDYIGGISEDVDSWPIREVLIEVQDLTGDNEGHIWTDPVRKHMETLAGANDEAEEGELLVVVYDDDEE